MKLELVSAQIGFVLASVIAKLQTAFAGAARVMREALRPRPCSIGGLGSHDRSATGPPQRGRHRTPRTRDGRL